MKKVRWRLASITALICAGVLCLSLHSIGTIVAEDPSGTSSSAAGERSTADETAADEKTPDEGPKADDKGKGSANKSKKSRSEAPPKKKSATKSTRQPAGNRGVTGQRGSGAGGSAPMAGGSGRSSGGGKSSSGPAGTNQPGSSNSEEGGSDSSSGNGGGRVGEGAAGPGEQDYPPDVKNAMQVQQQHTPDLLKQQGIVGTAVGLGDDGKPVIHVYTSGAGNPQVPDKIGDVPVKSVLSGPVRPLNGAAGQAKYDPRTRQRRPVPIGVSAFNEENPACGGSACFTGTLGCRLKAKDGSGYYGLSNSHVFSDEGNATLDTTIVQPGPADGNCSCVPEDVIGKLFAFKPFDFGSIDNIMDAAIISTSDALVSNRTLPDGYGLPRTYTIKKPQLGMRVQKYGRTTGYTKGRVTAINAFVIVGYTSGPVIFRDQIKITGDRGTIFGDHGDSGSLIVTEDRFPIALLYAGSDITHVVDGNPIQPILDEFGMEIDGDDSLDFPVPGKSGRAQPNVP